mmetsp:Transcript_23447/g.76232  ORF Transcript_23447/g.76232 Transcript_23447/m.76232 type:complete len:84 (+) Transcript_23447:3473-3724(+)
MKFTSLLVSDLLALSANGTLCLTVEGDSVIAIRQSSILSRSIEAPPPRITQDKCALEEEGHSSESGHDSSLEVRRCLDRRKLP